jgi:predicted secreted Zn-dependent protease
MTMTVPALVDIGEVAPEIAKDWRAYLDLLRLHEDGHVEIDKDGTRGLQSAFANFPPAVDCDTLERNLDARFDEAIGAIGVANDAYDETTKHGATQGAVYPK